MEPLMITQQLAEAILGVVSICGNALVVFVVVRYKKLQTITNYLIASLAVADLLVGAVGIPFVIVNNMGLPHEFYSCLFMNCVIVILTQISIFSLMVIAVERCAAVRYPIWHRTHFRGRVAGVVIAVAWLAGTLVGLVPMFGWHLGYPRDADNFICGFIFVIDMAYMVYFNFFGFVLTPIVIMFSTYGYIFWVVRTRTRQPAPTKPDEMDARKTLSRESKAALRIFAVLVLFAVCWLPIHVINSVTLLAGRTQLPAVIVAVFLTHANSAFNPILYALTNKALRDAFKTALGIKASSVDAVSAVTSVANNSQVA